MGKIVLTILCAFVCIVGYVDARTRKLYCINKGFDLLASSRKHTK